MNVFIYLVLVQWICIIFFVRSSLSANILAVTTLPSPSHHLWHKPYFSTLVKNGHNLTVLGHETESEKRSNYTMITLEGVYPKIHKDFDLEKLVYNGPLVSLKFLWDWDELVCKYDLETEGLQTLLNYPKDFKFDLIIWDISAGRCMYPLIDRFGKPPVVATSPFGLQSFAGYIFGNDINSYIPYYQGAASDKMNFIDRLKNFVYIHVMNLSRRYYLVPREFALAKTFFGENIRPIDDVERDFNILLANTDPIMDFAQPLPPSIIPVAGIHISAVKALPKDIQNLLDSSKNGVIVVAFGTNLNWKNFGEQQRVAFYEAFKKLPYTILMKSPKDGPKFSENVIVKEWLPQNDILAHPNVKLFITHGGSLGTKEAMFHGVPIVGMPFFLDQHGNIGKIEARELGRQINYFDATPDLVYETIRDVLDNPKYRKNMLTLSARYKDQPQTPTERALFWTEYVLRHGTGKHFSPATRDMNIFQRFNWDITVAFILILTLPSALLWKLLRKGNTTKQKRD